MAPLPHPRFNEKKLGEPQIKFLSYLIFIVMISYISLGFGHLFGWSATNLFRNPVQSTFEFMPVMIIALCNFYLFFTCGEFFGLLRYQFVLDEDAPAQAGFRLIAVRALAIFFVGTVCFYFLRIGFDESFFEKIFLTGLPLLMGSYLIIILGRLYRVHLMPTWYFRQKRILLFFCVISMLLSNVILFFPLFFQQIVVTIPAVI